MSIRWKITLAFALIILTMGTFIGIALLNYQQSQLIEEGEKRAVSLARTLAAAAGDPLLAGDPLRLGPMTRALTQDPDVVDAYVLDHDGRAAFHRDIGRIGSVIDPHAGDPGPLHAVLPIFVENVEVGTAVVTLSPDFIHRAERRLARALLQRLGLWSLVGLCAVLLLTEMQVRRIERLENAVRSVGGGDLGASAVVDGGDELARFAAGFNNMVGHLRQARREVERGVTETISVLAAAIEANDPYTRGHCERVARGTRRLCEELSLTPEQIREFELAALLHDIGKIGVPSEVLKKETRLTQEEERAMQAHSAIGAAILGRVSFLQGIASYVRAHHEDWDGGGYPDGLRGEESPLAARVIHVVDAFDAMTSDRPYRAALSPQEASRQLFENRAVQFDPRLVDLFLEIVRDGSVSDIRERVAQEISG